MATKNSPAGSLTRISASEMRANSDAFLAAWNDHDVDGLLAQLTDDIVWTDPALPEPAIGKPAVAAAVRDNFTALPDLHIPVESVEVFPDEERQMLLATWVVTGTMTGPLQGIAATGRDCRISGTTVSRLRDGLICEYTLNYDTLTMLQQLGILPASDGLGFKAVVAAQMATRVVAQQARKVLHR